MLDAAVHVNTTELANRADLRLAACSELVNNLRALGYIERRADPADGRAKLIVPTVRGRRPLERAGLAVARLEQRWLSHCPPTPFDTACSPRSPAAITGTRRPHLNLAVERRVRMSSHAIALGARESTRARGPTSRHELTA